MKHLKKYNESNEEFTLMNIIDIIQEFIDDGHEIVIFDDKEDMYFPDDIDEKRAKSFVFKRHEKSKGEFKIQVDFKESKKYSDLVKFLTEMDVAIERFNEEGFYLLDMKPMLKYIRSDEPDKTYKCGHIDFSFRGL